MELPRGFRTVRQLEKSNREMYEQFHFRFWNYVRNYQRTYHFTEEQAQDLFSNLLIEVFSSPLSYRNAGGISVVIRTRLSNAYKPILKSSKEEPSGFPGDEAFNDFAPTIDDPIRAIDRDNIIACLRYMNSAELAVIRLVYGIDGSPPHDINAVCFKLFRTRWWVYRRLESGIMKIQRALKLPETTCGIENFRH